MAETSYRFRSVASRGLHYVWKHVIDKNHLVICVYRDTCEKTARAVFRDLRKAANV